MIVRLKGASNRMTAYVLEGFQFYDSPIKSMHSCRTYAVFYCFNSMIVRLKGARPHFR